MRSSAPLTSAVPLGPRRGSVLFAIVAILIILMSIGSLMFHQVMRQQHLDSHRYTNGEVALQLAQSGLNLSSEYLQSRILEVGSNLHTLLIDSTPEAVNGSSVPVESPHVEELIQILGEDIASLELKVELRNFKSLSGQANLKGILPDPREKVGELAFVATGTFQGVRRSLVAAKQVRVFSTLAPVLSKFTLFVRDSLGRSPNMLSYSRLEPHLGFRLGEEKARPLVLYHRTEKFPAIVDAKFHPMGEEFEAYQPDRGGLVYLGGNDPWVMNLVQGVGAGRYEELFQLRRTRYLSESLLEGIHQECALYFGFYQGILESEKFGELREQARGLQDVQGRDLTDLTSALHLFGDTENLTPTLVLGPAFRRYVRLDLLDGYWYPYRSESAFRSASLTSPFDGDYGRYEEVMARVVTESYNRSFDYMASNFESHDGQGRLETGRTPVQPGPVLSERGLPRVGPAARSDEGFFYPQIDDNVPGFCSIQRIFQDGSVEDVFRGALTDLDGPLLEEILVHKAPYQVPDQASFEKKYLRGRTLEIPGLVHIQQGDLNLGAVNTGEGGMILVPGNITIQGRIVQTKPRRPLTLVSLGGDIRVRTEQNIDASLVCLRGRFTSSGRLNLAGSLAAGSLDLNQIVKGSQTKVLTYNSDLDSTDGEVYWENLRAIMDPEVRVYMDQGL